MRDTSASELDVMIRDFVGQLLVAKAEGWDRTKPARYRALVTALRIALRKHRALRPGPSAASSGPLTLWLTPDMLTVPAPPAGVLIAGNV